MSESLKSYVYPTTVDPYEPRLAEIVDGHQTQLLEKAISLIDQAGVMQLPLGADGPTALMMGNTITVQAFSSSRGWSFITVSEYVGHRSQYVIDHIGDQEFRILYVLASYKDLLNVFLNLSNPVKAAVYRSLLAAAISGENGEYTAADFERDEFSKYTNEQLSFLVEQYLLSEPNRQLANQHFETLSNPRTRPPGFGTVKKLYQ